MRFLLKKFRKNCRAMGADPLASDSWVLCLPNPVGLRRQTSALAPPLPPLRNS